MNLSGLLNVRPLRLFSIQIKWVRRNRTAIAGPVLRVHPIVSAIELLPEI